LSFFVIQSFRKKNEKHFAVSIIVRTFVHQKKQHMGKKTKYVTKKQLEEKGIDLSVFPNFSRSGSIIGMRKQYYGKGALLIIHGSYVYHVPEEIFNLF